MAGRRIEIRGTVQGVGFRPWVYRLARAAGLVGRVWNVPRGVAVEAFGTELELDTFIEELRRDTLPSARIVQLEISESCEAAPQSFVIETSGETGAKALSIPPDLATCDDCATEIFDRGDRRFGYAFTNCTSCGPRFTIAKGIPYDRATTTMSQFEMCEACSDEYGDIDDRRFHAQPNACPDCGPELSLNALDERGNDLSSSDPLRGAAELLKRGAIVAVKGLGGFHLACDASDDATVLRLRERKRRDEKPFAVMVGDLDAARALAEVDADEASLLTSPERPIVLLRARSGTDLAASVSPDTPLLGLFLPYTPLHHLLLDAVGRPLVMTSANVSEEPICRDNEEALHRLDGIADAFLVHDRDIAMRCDDSVARVIGGRPTIMRRSRGFVPRPFQLGKPVKRPILACGAHLKNTFCIAVDDTAYFGPHIGDLETVSALEFYEEAIERLQTILQVQPDVLAHDLHPGYLSTRYAKSQNEVTLVGVQHHHAHVTSLAAEHRELGPVLGVAFDGTGFGEDGTSWGGEFLWCFQGRYERLATFRPIALPGGNVAMREVWRIGYALIHDAFEGEPPIDSLPVFESISSERLHVVRQMIERELNSPPARGLGRYFDAFAVLALGRPQSAYEGQVAVALDHAADDRDCTAYPYEIDRSSEPFEVDMRPAVRAAVEDIQTGASPGQISSRFHETIIVATTSVCEELLAKLGDLPVGLTGGVFQNARISMGVETILTKQFRVLRHSEVPPGDGGIALGQALIADTILGDKG